MSDAYQTQIHNGGLNSDAIRSIVLDVMEQQKGRDANAVNAHVSSEVQRLLASASLSTGKELLQAPSGAWAGQRLLAAMQAGQPMSASVLRVNDSLRKDEWKAFDDVLIQEATLRLRGVADLIAAGFTQSVPNSMGKTIAEWEKVTDMDPAVISMDGLARGDLDTIEYDLDSVPLPITHKDFNLSIRRLSASRERGEALDTTKARIAGRLVAERQELMLFSGGPTYAGKVIYGYTTHPNRVTGGFTSTHWDDTAAGSVGAVALADVRKMKAGLSNSTVRAHGPYWLYIPSNFDGSLDEDFKSNSDKTVRQRLLEVDGLERITVSDQLAADNMVMVQASSGTIQLLQGEPLQTVQWDIFGGLAISFKAMQIQVPRLTADAQGRLGIYHMS